ncbi:MAG TPA: hypothetical protein VEC16_03075 [Alphaproteobacteria bacterium]|nr:hypothetical protein [Alphaproteobacteria bacterium]
MTTHHTNHTHELPHLSELIEDIKDKKELRTLDDGFVKNKMDAYFSERFHEQEKKKFLEKLKNSKTYKQFTKSKEYKFIIKELRAELRKVYGVFILEGYEKRKKILQELSELDKDDKEESMKLHEQLFNLHKSTKERMDHYDELYKTIFDTIENLDREDKSLAGKHKFTFMDLACGLNPISTVLFRDKIQRYYASDISTEDCEFLKDYFDTTELDAIIFPADLTDEKLFYKLEKIPVDICLIFKTLDGLERIKRNISKDLMNCLNTKYFAITFPTLSISAHREIKEHRRQWFEKMLDNLGWKYEKFTMDSELLYVIKKGK